VKLRKLLGDARGQGLVEFAVVLPLLVLVVLGVVEISYMLLDQHVVTKLTREGSNLISRNTSLADAATAMRSMSSRPVDFSGGSSKMIFSVIKKVATTGASNYDRAVLYQRYEYGGLAATSALTTRGSGSFGSGPEYEASNSDNDTNLQITNLPGNLVSLGGMLYVTEIFSRHPRITPLDRWGVGVPQTLYSIAYF
jgi:TadE-like protein